MEKVLVVVFVWTSLIPIFVVVVAKITVYKFMCKSVFMSICSRVTYPYEGEKKLVQRRGFWWRCSNRDIISNYWKITKRLYNSYPNSNLNLSIYVFNKYCDDAFLLRTIFGSLTFFCIVCNYFTVPPVKSIWLLLFVCKSNWLYSISLPKLVKTSKWMNRRKMKGGRASKRNEKKNRINVDPITVRLS